MYTHQIRNSATYYYLNPIIRPKGRPEINILKDTSIDIFKSRLDGFIQADDRENALKLIDDYAPTLKSVGIDIEKLKCTINDYFDYQALLKELDRCIDSNTFQEAISLIDKNVDLIKRMGKSPESIKEIVKGFETLSKTLDRINDLIKRGHIEKALEMADKNKELFENLGLVFEAVRGKILSHTPIKLTD